MCSHDSEAPTESMRAVIFLPVLWISVIRYNKDEKVIKKPEFIHSHSHRTGFQQEFTCPGNSEGTSDFEKCSQNHT